MSTFRNIFVPLTKIFLPPILHLGFLTFKNAYIAMEQHMIVDISNLNLKYQYLMLKLMLKPSSPCLAADVNYLGF